MRARRFAFCAELTVRFHRPARPEEELVVTGELAANRRGKILEAKASVANGAGDFLAEAAGKYIPIKTAGLSPMLGELVGEWRWLLDDTE